MSGVEMSGVELSGVEMSGVEISGVEMSTFGMKIGHFNPRLYNRIYCAIPGVEMSPTLASVRRGGKFKIRPGRRHPSYATDCTIIWTYLLHFHKLTRY